MKPKLSAEYVAGYNAAKKEIQERIAKVERQLDIENFGEDVRRGISLLYSRLRKEFK